MQNKAIKNIYGENVVSLLKKVPYNNVIQNNLLKWTHRDHVAVDCFHKMNTIFLEGGVMPELYIIAYT